MLKGKGDVFVFGFSGAFDIADLLTIELGRTRPFFVPLPLEFLRSYDFS